MVEDRKEETQVVRLVSRRRKCISATLASCETEESHEGEERAMPQALTTVPSKIKALSPCLFTDEDLERAVTTDRSNTSTSVESLQ